MSSVLPARSYPLVPARSYQSKGGSVAPRFATVAEYLESFPPPVRERLEEVRRAILAVVPEATESISYHMPTISVDGRGLLGFAGWKHHIGVYPVPEGDEEFERDIAPYRAARSTARFPLREPVPAELIGRLVALLLQRRANS